MSFQYFWKIAPGRGAGSTDAPLPVLEADPSQSRKDQRILRTSDHHKSNIMTICMKKKIIPVLSIPPVSIATRRSSGHSSHTALTNSVLREVKLGSRISNLKERGKMDMNIMYDLTLLSFHFPSLSHFIFLLSHFTLISKSLTKFNT